MKSGNQIEIDYSEKNKDMCDQSIYQFEMQQKMWKNRLNKKTFNKTSINDHLNYES